MNNLDKELVKLYLHIYNGNVNNTNPNPDKI